MSQIPLGGDTPRPGSTPPPYPSGGYAKSPLIATLESKLPLISLILSAIALVLVVVCLVRGCSDSSSIGRGLSSYDFSSPEAAARSLILIESNADVRAQVELARMREWGDGRDVGRTLEIDRVADFGDIKFVFLSYMAKGKKKKNVQGFEKNLETKQWSPRFVSSAQVRKTNEQLAPTSMPGTPRMPRRNDFST